MLRTVQTNHSALPSHAKLGERLDPGKYFSTLFLNHHSLLLTTGRHEGVCLPKSMRNEVPGILYPLQQHLLELQSLLVACLYDDLV